MAKKKETVAVDRFVRDYRQLVPRAVRLLERYYDARIKRPKDAQLILAWELALREFFYTTGFRQVGVLALCKEAKLPGAFMRDEQGRPARWLSAGEEALKDWEAEKERKADQQDQKLRRG